MHIIARVVWVRASRNFYAVGYRPPIGIRSIGVRHCLRDFLSVEEAVGVAVYILEVRDAVPIRVPWSGSTRASLPPVGNRIAVTIEIQRIQEPIAIGIGWGKFGTDFHIIPYRIKIAVRGARVGLRSSIADVR